MSQKTLLSVVIVSFNTCDLLKKCLESLLKEVEGLAYEIIVVDNASKDASVTMVKSYFPEVKLIVSDKNLGFAAANNYAFYQAQGEYVVLLNSDAFLSSGALKIALKHMKNNPQVGIAGGRLVGEDGSWQPSARMFPSLLNDFLTISGLSARFPTSKLFGRVDRTWADSTLEAEVDWVPGAFAIIPKEVLEKAGYFDERFFLYYEEVDLCRRIKALGYKICYWPDIKIIHLGGQSSKTIEHLTFSSSGSQLTLWRMRSAFLYYYKHHGKLISYLAMQIEWVWNFLRAYKNSTLSNQDTLAKKQDSEITMYLLKRAWNETSGGKVSPARPW